MSEYFNAPERNAIRTILAGLVRGSLVWLVGLPLALALLFGLLGAVVGLPPVEFALDFLSKAAIEFALDFLIALSVPVAQLWAVGFFAVAICFGVGRGLPALLQHRPLSAGLITRITQTVGLGALPLPGIGALCARAHRWRLSTRPSRTALSTASDLAGSAPRLE